MEDTGLFIQYGIIDGYDSTETVHLSYFDPNPLELRYYMFGSYDAKVFIYDISVTEMSSDQEASLRCSSPKSAHDQHRCRHICHNNCIGCSKANSSTSCAKCRFSGYSEDGQITCLDSCPKGYEKNRSLDACQDIDECRGDGAVVYRTRQRDEVYRWRTCASGSGSRCVNVPGGFGCDCLPGFSGVEGNCTDVDECEAGVRCGEGKECRNLVGGFRCECGPGLSEVGGVCVDVDECLVGGDECQANSHCVNRVGSYRCECDEGFSGNGVFCEGERSLFLV